MERIATTTMVTRRRPIVDAGFDTAWEEENNDVVAVANGDPCAWVTSRGKVL
jgi:hypothetical protein